MRRRSPLISVSLCSIRPHFLQAIPVHIFVIGWLYVVIMISIVSDSILKGVLRFLILGALPCGLYFWFALRKRAALRETLAASDSQTTSRETSVKE
jgi:hypothetical protein